MRPPTIPLFDAVVLVLAVQALLIALAALVVARKMRRDRRERAGVRRRAEFAAAIATGSHADLLRVCQACVKDPAVLVDLLYVLKHAEPILAARRSALLAAARETGLLRALRLALQARRPTARGVAALTLSALRLPGGEARVARLIADRDADVRLASCSALANWSSPAAAIALLDSLDRFDLPPERIVEKLGGAWAAPVVHGALQQTLRDDACVSPQRMTNRVQLVRALELSGYQDAEPELLRLLDTGDPEEQIGAARALGAAGSPRSVPALLNALTSDSWPLRAQAARALVRLVAVEALPHLAARLSDPAWWVRKQAGRALVALGPAGGYELLEAGLEHEDRYARDRASEELRLAALAHHARAPEPPGSAIVLAARPPKQGRAA
jgi:HEAT repeats/HEAT repeat